MCETILYPQPMIRIILISFIAFTSLNAFSQHCLIKDSLTTQDSMNVFLDFTYHLYRHKKIEFQANLTSTYTYEGFNRTDSVFYFMIRDSERQAQGDGEFISRLEHKTSILNNIIRSGSR